MLSAAILTHNDEKRIKQCLTHLSFCDEILIIDDASSDKTVKLAKQFPVRVIQHKLQDDFAAQRNRLLEQARGEWILFIDPDEEVTTELANEIKATLKQPKYDVYLIKRQDFFWGEPIQYGEVQTAAQIGFIRLVKKKSGVWKGAVHESFISKKPVGQLHNPLHHYPHQSISAFIERVNFYSTIRSKELLQQGKKATVRQIFVLPFAKFFYTYILKLGFKDGAAGFIYSFMMSFHSFLVRAKLYQYQHIKEGV